MAMSLREKGAWIGLVTLIGVYGFYFARLGLDLREGRAEGFLPMLAVCVLVLVLLQFGLVRLAVGAAPREPRAPGDERELIAGLKATRVAFYALSIGVGLALCVAVLVFLLARDGRISWEVGGVIAINAVVLAYVVTELLRYAGHIVYMRRMS
jgi:hypothetical protein